MNVLDSPAQAGEVVDRRPTIVSFFQSLDSGVDLFTRLFHERISSLNETVEFFQLMATSGARIIESMPDAARMDDELDGLLNRAQEAVASVSEKLQGDLDSTSTGPGVHRYDTMVVCGKLVEALRGAEQLLKVIEQMRFELQEIEVDAEDGEYEVFDTAEELIASLKG